MAEEKISKLVEIIESCMVVPDKETPKHRLWLSNLDLFNHKDHVPTFYFYKPNGINTNNDFFSVETLKKALGKALVTFYPLAGRLAYDEDGRLEVDCNAEGAFFSVARAHCTVEGFGDFRPSPALRQLLVPSVTEPERSSVLMLFQLTVFQCGGVSLGCALHHSVIDGVTALHFINSWSDIARGGADMIKVPPFFDRTLLRSRSPPTVRFNHEELTRDEIYSNKRISLEDCETTMLTISKDQLNTLKQGFNAGERNLSTFKAVAVHLWRTACKARELADEQDTRLFMHVDARARLKPALPMGFIGNAIVRSSGNMKVGELVSKPFELGVAKLEETINRVDDEYMRSFVDLFEKLKSHDEKILMGTRSFKRTDFLIVSWLALPIYEADFGWGKPWFMGRANMRYVGQAYVKRTPGDSGGVSVALAFETQNMARFKEIFYSDLES